jgi:GntR family transcriptional regulator of arabinose operon
MKAVKTNSRTKYHEIKEAIKRDIIAGKYIDNDGQLPTCREFMKIFKVSYATANKAVQSLAEEGYSKVIQGKGIFAARPRKRKITRKAGKAGFFMPHTGDLFQKLFSATLRRLDNHDIMSVPIYPEIAIDEIPQFEQEEKIEKIISLGLDSLVIYGTRHLPYKILKKHYKKIQQTNFIICAEAGFDFPGANYILTDFPKSGYLAADHLLKNGRKKLLFLTFENLDEKARIQNGVKTPNYDIEVLSGVQSAFSENGLDPKKGISIFYDNPHPAGKRKTTEKVTDFIKAGGDGIICMGDNRALNVYNAVKKVKKKIGKDVGVVGFYNTSWCEVFDPELTSVSICEKEISKQVTRAIHENWQDRHVVVEPELIVRSSG